MKTHDWSATSSAVRARRHHAVLGASSRLRSHRSWKRDLCSGHKTMKEGSQTSVRAWHEKHACIQRTEIILRNHGEFICLARAQTQINGAKHLHLLRFRKKKSAHYDSQGGNQGYQRRMSLILNVSTVFPSKASPRNLTNWPLKAQHRENPRNPAGAGCTKRHVRNQKGGHCVWGPNFFCRDISSSSQKCRSQIQRKPLNRTAAESLPKDDEHSNASTHGPQPMVHLKRSHQVPQATVRPLRG